MLVVPSLMLRMSWIRVNRLIAHLLILRMSRVRGASLLPSINILSSSFRVPGSTMVSALSVTLPYFGQVGASGQRWDGIARKWDNYMAGGGYQ
jgi:hypothetical protein